MLVRNQDCVKHRNCTEVPAEGDNDGLVLVTFLADLRSSLLMTAILRWTAEESLSVCAAVSICQHLSASRKVDQTQLDSCDV